jgi:hypothetical protein
MIRLVTLFLNDVAKSSREHDLSEPWFLTEKGFQKTTVIFGSSDPKRR